jgi:hypothetical protein
MIKIVMQIGRINPSKLRLGKHDHMFMEWSIDKQNTDKKHHIYQGTSYNRRQLYFI